MHISLHVKYPLFFSGFNENLIFSTDFRKLLKHQISLKSVSFILLADSIIQNVDVVVLLSVGLPVANAPDVLQPCGLLYYP